MESGREERGTDDRPLAVKVLTSKSAEEKAEESQREREKSFYDWLTANATMWTAIFAGSTIVVAIAQVFLFWRQLDYMTKGLRDARKASNAARISAEAAVTSSVQAKDSSERQLRAYVSTKPTTVHGFEVGVLLQVSLNLTNHGKTPAFGIRTEYGIDILPSQGERFSPPPTTNRVMQEASIFPENEVRVRIIDRNRRYTADEIADVSVSRRRLFIWGTVYYRDAFGVERHTDFRASAGGEDFAKCFPYNPTLDKQPEFLWSYEHGQNQAT